MTLQKNDFVSVEYTGIIKETGQVFDTTSEEVAKKEKIHNDKITYGAITICIGQNQILPGIDAALIGKKEDMTFSIELPTEQAFGKKNAKLIRLVPANIFTKQRIQPFVGLEVQIDNLPGIIRTISGGRVLVDFNHPLAGKDLKYDVKINKKVTDPAEKIKSYINLTFNIKEPKIKVTENKAEIEMALPPQISETVIKKLTEIVPEVNTIEFVSKTPKKDIENKLKQ